MSVPPNSISRVPSAVCVNALAIVSVPIDVPGRTHPGHALVDPAIAHLRELTMDRKEAALTPRQIAQVSGQIAGGLAVPTVANLVEGDDVGAGIVGDRRLLPSFIRYVRWIPVGCGVPAPAARLSQVMVSAAAVGSSAHADLETTDMTQPDGGIVPGTPYVVVTSTRASRTRSCLRTGDPFRGAGKKLRAARDCPQAGRNDANRGWSCWSRVRWQMAEFIQWSILRLDPGPSCAETPATAVGCR